MSSSIRKVLRKALLSLQLPASKEGATSGSVSLGCGAAGLAKPKG